MNCIDKNLKTANQDKTIGIIIVRKDNEFVMKYCSDERIYRTTYELIRKLFANNIYRNKHLFEK